MTVRWMMYILIPFSLGMLECCSIFFEYIQMPANLEHVEDTIRSHQADLNSSFLFFHQVVDENGSQKPRSSKKGKQMRCHREIQPVVCFWCLLFNQWIPQFKI